VPDWNTARRESWENNIYSEANSTEENKRHEDYLCHASCIRVQMIDICCQPRIIAVLLKVVLWQSAYCVAIVVLWQMEWMHNSACDVNCNICRLGYQATARNHYKFHVESSEEYNGKFNCGDFINEKSIHYYRHRQYRTECEGRSQLNIFSWLLNCWTKKVRNLPKKKSHETRFSIRLECEALLLRYTILRVKYAHPDIPRL